MFNRIFILFVAFAALAGGTVTAGATERFALVIGNSNYQSVAPLDNPGRDAAAVESLLKSASFDVTVALDVDQVGLRRAVSDFAGKLAGHGQDAVALVYFAGHGMQIDGENYLLPVDARVNSEADVPMQGVRLADVMNLLNALPARTRIVILDACRNNPFAAIENKIGAGLAIVNAPAGTLVAYSTSPGATAADGEGANSPFTAALVKAAGEAGTPLATVLQDVRTKVHTATNGVQTPWEVTALTEPFRFFPGTTDVSPSISRTDKGWGRYLSIRSPQEAYNVVVRENNVTVYNIFLNVFPNTVWAERASVIFDRRMMMLAWYQAVTLNSIAAYEAFLERYSNSDLAQSAKKLLRRAEQRAELADLSATALPAASGPARTIIKEVLVPVTKIKEVIKEVRIPITKIKEVVKEVHVPVVKEVVRTETVIKTVRVPVIKTKTVVKTVRVPVVKTRTIVKKIRVPVVKIKTVIKRVPVVRVRTVVKRVPVRVPCRCKRRRPNSSH